LPSAQLARLIETLQGELPETRIELVDGTREQLHTQLAGRKLLACISLKSESEPGQRSVELLREHYGLVVSLNHRFAFYESIQLSDLNDERFIVRTHCETFDSTTKLLAERGIRSQVVYRTDQDDRALALVGAGLGVALMPAIFGAPNVKKVPIRDFDAKRVISLHWNEMSPTIGSVSSLLLPRHTIGPHRIGSTSRPFVDYLVPPPSPNLIALASRFDRLGLDQTHDLFGRQPFDLRRFQSDLRQDRRAVLADARRRPLNSRGGAIEARRGFGLADEPDARMVQFNDELARHYLLVGDHLIAPQHWR
jgi:hypothetical protein